MVLADLGSRLQGALRSLSSAPDSKIDAALMDSVLKDICGALLHSDVNIQLVKQFRSNIKSQVKLDKVSAGVNKKKLLQKTIFDELVQLVDPGTEQWKPVKSPNKSNVVMFVGLQGAGKTTTCTKLAHHYQRKGWKVALVCTDTFRAGAFDQLKQNATRAKIPFYGSYSETDPVQLAMDGVEKFKEEKFDLIIVDTSGRHKQEQDLFDEMAQISSVVNPDSSIFVMDGTIGQAADAQARAFRETVDIGSIIITKMDGHAKGGGAISAVAATGSNIIFIGTGEHIADLEPFNARSFVGKMLGMGDLGGLVELTKDLKLDQNSKLMKNLEAGVFTLHDMREQFNTISSMGPLSKVMEMMPGIPPEMAKMGDVEGSKKIKKFMCILDSMTEAELSSDGKVFMTTPSRVHRVAIGSGGTVFEVEELLKQHKMFAGMVKSMGGNKGLMNQMQKGGAVNPNQMGKLQSQMNKMLPPGMLEQMGGMGGITEMMKQMGVGGGRGGGMPDMSKMMDMMSQMGMGGQMPPGMGRGGPSRRKR